MHALRIAIADDELDMRDYLSRALDRLGHRVVAIAENGKQLVDLCSREHPDLVLTDIRMPEMDGIAAAESICREQAIPVVFISAFQPESHALAYAADHASVYVQKPIRLAMLNTAVETAFTKQHAVELIQQLFPQPLALREIVPRLECTVEAIRKASGSDELAAWHTLETRLHNPHDELAHANYWQNQ